MSILIRDVQEKDLAAILALNNEAGPGILALNTAQLRHFYQTAVYFRVAEVNDELAGFLVAFDQESSHQSTNYQWFRQQYPEFVYIDRVVVAQAQRGLGLGRVFYADITSFAEVRTPILACEVFLEPRNDAVLLFHGTYGFQEVGQRTMEESGRRVSMLIKPLPSYAWVKQRWLDGPGLPDLPWLAGRAMADIQQQQVSE